jgi:hypothetical protein
MVAVVEKAIMTSLTIRTNSRLRSSVSGGRGMRITWPRVWGLSPRSFIKSIDEKLDEKENSLLEI